MQNKIVILIENGFQDAEVIYPYYRLKEEFKVELVGVKKRWCKGKYGYWFKTEALDKIKNFDCVLIPGGNAPKKLARNKKVIEFVKKAYSNKKLIAAICHGPLVLIKAGVIKNKKVTCYKKIKNEVKKSGAKYFDKKVIVDDGIITSRKPDDLIDFCNAIIKWLKQKR